MSKKKKSDKQGGSGVDLLDKDKSKDRLQKPSKYNVIFHNDDYTSMLFVATILVMIFRRDQKTAWSITNDIHDKGKGIAGGPYSKEIAETKATRTMESARHAGYPLLATVEKV
tara:strand:+ start:329 stop:667 length:339 start_codon:yes stop_codon:yes gene_type:complete